VIVPMVQDVQFGKKKFVVSARRKGSTMSGNGIEGLIVAVRLLVRLCRRDYRYEVCVWERDAFPAGFPIGVVVVPDREAAKRLVDDLVLRIESNGISGIDYTR